MYLSEYRFSGNFNTGQGNDFAGGTPFFPNYTNDNQERIQSMVQGVGDFPIQLKKSSMSRQSSGDEGMSAGAMGPTYHRLDYSEVAVCGLSGNR